MSRSNKLILAAAVFIPLPAFSGAADVPASQPQALSSIVEEPLYVDNGIVLERRQVLEIPAEGLQTILVVDPSIVEARVLTDRNKVYLQALALGRTYMHLWTSQGRRSVQIEVVSSLKKKDAVKSRKDGAFKVAYGLNSYSQTYVDKKNDRVTRSNGTSYHARARGKTPLGLNQTDVRYQQQDHKGDISSLRANFQNRSGQLEAGDIFSEFSQLTMPLTGSQGVHWSSPKARALQFDAILGYKNKQMWGGRAFAQEAEQPLVGMKAAWKPGRKFELFAVQSRVFQSGVAQVGENRGIGFNRKGRNWALKMEGSQGKEGKAWFGDVEYRLGNSYVFLTQRNVDAGYVTASNGSWERGRSGQTAQVGLENLGLLSLLDVRYDQFLNHHQQSYSNPAAVNREMRGQIRLEMSGIKVAQDVALRDFPGVSGPSRATLYKTIMETQIGRWSPRLGLRKEVNRYLEMNTLDSDDLGLEVGLKADPFKFFSCAAAAEAVSSKNFFTGERRSFVNLTGGVRAAGSFWKPVRHFLSADYREQTRYASVKLQAIVTQFRTEYGAGKGMSLYVAGQMENQLANQNLGHTFSVNTGIEWTSGLGFLTMTSRKAEGLVFKDVNGDGIKQEGEPGYEGIEIVMNDSKIQKTDASGRFEFKPVKGDVKLAMNAAVLPANTRLASSNPQVYAESDDGKAIKALFAVAYRGEISGSVFNDVNGNGVLDTEDKPLKNASISLNDGRTEVTDPAGQFLFPGLAPGTYTLALNVYSLPADMVLTSPDNLKADLDEGEKETIVFLAMPSRYIRGRVFWDKNGNNSYQEGEKGLAGARLFTESGEAVTGPSGTYYLTGFQAGSLTLSLDEATLKGQWEAASQFPRSFEVPLDSPFVRTVDIPLKKIR